ncbi:hypothetical protein DEU56DRAFT_459669 [Suillus clintonianus]|uniref:uncharacterized protein n=1 Tax=Suillus clintonianus TaxID=1904413 RepID=UPI001B87868A|nr:uncharacterized protein DEU56DRAFT_459669 [Suillus clintonianus]KAG2131025.1 hypothetical protein DEU56DRAFT_459669 [Suillus clintonianus]
MYPSRICVFIHMIFISPQTPCQLPFTPGFFEAFPASQLSPFNIITYIPVSHFWAPSQQMTLRVAFFFDYVLDSIKASTAPSVCGGYQVGIPMRLTLIMSIVLALTLF